MVSDKTIKSLEFDKILSAVSEFAVLTKSKEILRDFVPSSNFVEAQNLLQRTEEAYKLLFNYGIGGVFYFDDIEEELNRVDLGGVLNNSELLRVSDNLKSSRMTKSSIESVSDDSIVYLREIASRLYVNQDLEKEITSKIISEEEISDNASPKLYSIRKSIRELNAKIRDKLNSFMRGSSSLYLQEDVVTMRGDRYVIPVKSEYRSKIKGFIHDQSSSGATVFIEPEQVMELNNELRKATFDEAEEIYKILVDLTEKVSLSAKGLKYNRDNISEIDCFYARAQYSFKNKCSKPSLNNNGIIKIINGRHPLISAEKVVPISLEIGKDYNFLLISGPNTGGKTVTLKLTGLFTLMGMSGIYIPADDECILSVFNGVYSDIGDEQSIEQNLSTFSSHIKNIIEILNCLDNKSLVLLDELGAGTDPDEGSALALSIINKLLDANCFGIITTHYSRLKEFAMTENKIENASMEFDALSLQPLYKINIGIPGSSNAIDISRVLGIGEEIANRALSYLSEKKVSFENVLKKAEAKTLEAEEKTKQLEMINFEREEELKTIQEEREKLTKLRESIYYNAKQETKRIVADKLEEAEEIVAELKDILKQANLESKEIFRASELKNKLQNSKYLEQENSNAPFILKNVTLYDIKVGNKVYVKSLDSFGKVLSVKSNKKEVELLIGDIKTVVKINDLYNSEKNSEVKKDKIRVSTSSAKSSMPIREINVIGKSSLEALEDLKGFIDQAVVHNLEEIKIIHGVGAGILLKAIREYLKTDKRVKEFRKGVYGEGENGVTFIKLK